MKIKLLPLFFICAYALSRIAGAVEAFHPGKLAALDEAVK